jgi:NAD(P)-dependent dehydrogenase (short-subunit alcohol dehydrogenase family)
MIKIPKLRFASQNHEPYRLVFFAFAINKFLRFCYARVVAFLIGDDAKWINGQRLEVSGGIYL